MSRVPPPTFAAAGTWIFTAILLSAPDPSICLTGFDCTEVREFSSVDLTAVAPCPTITDPLPSRTDYGYVLQRQPITKVRVTVCKAAYIQNMIRCGMHSHSASPTDGVTMGLRDIPPKDCIMAAATGDLLLHDTKLTGLKLGQPKSVSITIAGTKTQDGTCTGESYYYRGVKYPYVTVERDYTVTISEVDAEYDQTTNSIITPTGITAPYSDLRFDDAVEGNHYWSPSSAAGSCDIHIIYAGPIDIVTQTKDGADTKFAVVTAVNHVFALRMLENTTGCGQPVVQTEHPRLLLSFDPNNNFITSGNTQTDLIPYINSKFLYSEIAWARRLQNLSSDTIARRCALHRQTLLHQLQLARDQPEMVGQIFQSPGIIGRAVGEVLYLARCAPLRLSLRRTAACYDSMPVTDAANRTLFLTGVSRIVTDHAETVPCTGPFLSTFHVDGKWYRFDPVPQEVTPPPQLQPDGQPRVSFEVLAQIGSAGLYTADEVRQFSRLLQFTALRSAVTNTVARAATGDAAASSRLDMQNLFTADHALQIVTSGMSRLWGWFGRIGTFISSVIGIVFVLKVVQFIIKTTLNGLTIAHASGCTIGLLAAFWTSATSYLVRRQDRERFVRVPVVVAAEEGRAHSVPDPELAKLTGCPVQ